MNSKKNQYIKYTRAELENYTQHDETCVKKVNCVEVIRFSPTIISTFQDSIGRILARKIGKFDMKLNGIVLDFRNTKVLSSQSIVRQDSPYSAINVETNFYVFSPRKGAIVTGIVKYINRMSIETVISVVIYRVFNVKVTVKGKVKHELEKNQEIQIRVKDFHFDNVIPFIEGEIVDKTILVKSKKLFDEIIDSGISESSISSEVVKGETSASQDIKIKQERESSVESSIVQPPKSRKRKSSPNAESKLLKRIKAEPVTDDDDQEVFLSKLSANKNKESSESTSTAFKQEKSDTVLSLPKVKKMKNKKKRLIHEEDDFESSLQNIINAGLDSGRIEKDV